MYNGVLRSLQDVAETWAQNPEEPLGFFEYYVGIFQADDLSYELNILACDGWELVLRIDRKMWLFRRSV